MRIRSLMLAGVATLGLASVTGPAAQAADYPVLRGSQIEDAPQAPNGFDSGTMNWSGFYLGGGAGVSDTKFAPGGTGLQGLARSAYRNTVLGAEIDMGGLVSDLPTKRDSGATYFGFGGYNFAFGDVILGFEADYTRSEHRYAIKDFIARQFQTSDGDINNFSLATNQGATLQDYATARLRMGWAYGRIMPFATVGGAVGRFDTTSTIDATYRFTRINPITGVVQNNVVAAGYPLTVGNSKTNVYGFGLALGGGIDMALTDNLFVRAEYQLIRFADVEGTTTTVNTARVAAGLKF
ncbi:outer membrane protein [Bosea sp. PAMC 26642]|uniref:outer membrane protein n=1 Tax=Bosea sp. (strain PAMC 26642) TaxID=1792307 RepID=UPI000ABF9E6E|nr:outer membrane beta-barrel protein [Bosea sp. PAMC 26642]